MGLVNLTNLTQHPIDIFKQGSRGEPSDPHVCVWPSRLYQPVRLPESSQLFTTVELVTPDSNPITISVPIVTVTYDPVQLPVYDSSMYYIVPRIVADMFRARPDLVFPYRLLRDKSNKAIGATVLGRFHTLECPNCKAQVIPILDASYRPQRMIYRCTACGHTELQAL